MSIFEKKVSRRNFIVKSSIGAGVMIGVALTGCGPFRTFVNETVDESDGLPYRNKYDAITWFEITADDNIRLHSPKVEMGQGIFTGLAQLAAEELGVDIDRIEVVNASTMSGPIDPRSTGGSDSISSLWIPLRELAAKMREMLKANAAELMGVSAESLTVGNGQVAGNGKSISFGNIVKDAKKWKEPRKVTLKTKDQFKIIGKPIPRIDLEPKVMGEPIFGFDVTMPRMLYGSVVRCPYVDATMGPVDASKAKEMPGVVKVVVKHDCIGVVAKTKYEADAAKETIVVKWKRTKNWEQADIERAVEVGKGKPHVIQKEGKPDNFLEGEDVITAEFKSPIGAHAHIEPNGCVAHVTDDKVVIRMSTQVPKFTRTEVAERLQLKEEQVDVQSTYLGGGFGRRLHTPNAIQAVVLSKAVGKPVHVFFTRQEEFQNDTFRPPTHHVLKAKLGDDGLIEAIEHNLSSGDVAFGPDGMVIVPPYAETLLGADIGAWRGGMFQYKRIPNIKAISWRVPLPFATSWWRSLGLLANTFAIESFIDELALNAGKDPVQFRLDQILDDERGKRYKGVIKAAAEKGEWGKKMPEGSAQGFAASIDANTPVAHVVEVSVEGKDIKVHKVTCSIDCGIVVNPDGVRAQCEGGIIMGLSAAMYEKMEVVNGQIKPVIYGPYKMARMAHAPKEIDTVIIDSDNDPSGVGEPPMGPIGAAIANAVFRITGQRLRELPLTIA